MKVVLDAAADLVLARMETLMLDVVSWTRAPPASVEDVPRAMVASGTWHGLRVKGMSVGAHASWPGPEMKAERVRDDVPPLLPHAASWRRFPGNRR